MSEYEYYTVTLDHTDSWHTRAILIIKAKNEEDALNHFGVIHGMYYAGFAKVTKGVHIENGFQDLITDGTQKIIVKVKGKSETAPTAFSYSNSISIKHAA